MQELISKASNARSGRRCRTASASRTSASRSKSRSRRTGTSSATSTSASTPIRSTLANGPESLVDNNSLSWHYRRRANGDSSRAGGNGTTPAPMLGVSNTTFGTLTFGRQYSFTNDLSARLRSVRRRLRLLADRHLRHGRAGHRRDRDGALQHLGQVSGRLQRLPRRRRSPSSAAGSRATALRRLPVRSRRRLRRFLGRRGLRLRQGRA